MSRMVIHNREMFRIFVGVADVYDILTHNFLYKLFWLKSLPELIY